MSDHLLSEERARRLAELRAKYPKPELPVEVKPSKYHTSTLTIILHFGFKSECQQEADKMAFSWLWNKDFEIGNNLLKQYRKDGLRDVSFAGVVGRPKEEVVGCEIAGCSQESVSVCYTCEKPLCRHHSYPTISLDDGDVFVCPACFFG